MSSPTFTLGCPDCEHELGMHPPPAATHKHRHPESDPKENMRKELTQCQNCWKSRTEGIKLFLCTACKIDLYCSKECQKAAWPSHKEKCKINRRIQTLGNPDQLKIWELLRAFTSKHRPTLAEAGCRALDVGVDAGNATRNVLVVFLQHRPEHKRTENAFYVMSAQVLPFEHFGDQKAAEMREQLASLNRQNKNTNTGALGNLFVVLFCTQPVMMNVAAVAFHWDVKLQKPGQEWREWLTKRLNEGIVS